MYASYLFSIKFIFQLSVSLFPPLSAGSYIRPVFFEVRKSETGCGQQDVVEVVVPQELRGRSEIIVVISQQPIKGLATLKYYIL